MFKYLRNRFDWIDYVLPKNIVIHVDDKIVWQSSNKRYINRLGEYLDKERQRRNLSIPKFAKFLNMNKETISSYIYRGNAPRSENQEKICKALGISEKDLESLID